MIQARAMPATRKPPSPRAKGGAARRPARRRTAPAGWSVLPTEARHAGSRDLDRLGAEEIVALLLEEDRRGLDAARRQARAVARAARWAAETLAGGGTVVFAGAGTSGRLGVLEAAECPPTFGTDPARIRAVLAGGRRAVFRSREGAEDSAAEGRRAVADVGAGDLVVGLSASAVTPFTRAALAAARRRRARTVLLTCASRRVVRRVAGPHPLADLVICLDTGPEILTGSTRLKAGSATKAVLNALTTAAMVRLGKVFENWMVDLRPGSAKLRDRALRIVAVAGRVPRATAVHLLAAAGGETKTALVMARTGLPAAAARRRLKAAAGRVRAALAATPHTNGTPSSPRRPT